MACIVDIQIIFYEKKIVSLGNVHLFYNGSKVANIKDAGHHTFKYCIFYCNKNVVLVEGVAI